MKKWIIIFLAVVVIGLATYHFAIIPKQEAKQSILLETATQTCNPVSAPCQASDSKHIVTLHFPEKVVYLKPFRMRVTMQGYNAALIEKVDVDFKMVGMDMGLNRFTLSQHDAKNSNLSYEGEGILPVCVSGRVDWIANVYVVTTNKVYEAVFEFKVEK